MFQGSTISPHSVERRRVAHNIIDLDALLEQLVGEAEHAKGLDGLGLHAICAACGSLLCALVQEEGYNTHAGEGEAGDTRASVAIVQKGLLGCGTKERSDGRGCRNGHQPHCEVRYLLRD